jgi:DNA mismatch endonuclease (patch repair protein)
MEKALRAQLPTGKFENVAPTRSRAMAAVKGKGNKTTERRLRLAMVRAGIRGWTLHYSDIPGRPDFFFRGARIAVFVDGCFWHGCQTCGHIPKKNNAFWLKKIERNRDRDRDVTRTLLSQGISVMRFWEHSLQEDLGGCLAALKKTLSASEQKLA